MSLRMRGMPTKCLLPNSKFERFSRDFRVIVPAVRMVKSVRNLLPICELHAILERFCDFIVSFALWRSLFFSRRRAIAGRLPPVCYVVRSRHSAVLWGLVGQRVTSTFPPPPQEDIPCSTARDVSASQAAPAAPPPCHTAVVPGGERGPLPP